MLKNIMKVFISNGLTSFFNLLCIFLLPKILGIEEYAIYQKYIMYVGYIYILHFGIASGMSINYAGENYQEIDRSVYKSEIKLIYIILSVCTFFTLLIWIATQNQYIFYIMLSIIPIDIVGSYKALYQAWNQFTPYSVVNSLPVIAPVMTAVIAVMLKKEVGGRVLILSYILVHLAILIYIWLEYRKHTYGIKAAPLLSRANLMTAETGFLVTLGNYVNGLIHTCDKQFVDVFFGARDFAIYSFSISTQNIIMVFITAFSAPFYPVLARKDFDKSKLCMIKELLLVFGSASGCGYYILRFFIINFMPDYCESVEIIQIYFMAIPALAVINAILTNLYKVTSISSSN